MADGSGTDDINNVFDLIVDNGSWGELKGFIKIVVHNVNGCRDVLYFPVDICVEEWDQEDQVFNYESYLISDVEEW